MILAFFESSDKSTTIMSLDEAVQQGKVKGIVEVIVKDTYGGDESAFKDAANAFIDDWANKHIESTIRVFCVEQGAYEKIERSMLDDMRDNGTYVLCVQTAHVDKEGVRI
jgi:hypothetical protein